ncbi:hypothetical protein [Corallococcus macrosporus]|uniref:Uncharacterized protein n=1 Tax=Myxococcus fulvus (strain ATCC BAA-855 / HW-1) TaxID=483219 RepID=F8CC22_MYXFH|nr:hypothetical protein [Corallococcus macrosporus]AEI67179.1 hypothetical protein LILAB_26435 [Corallococcus macrosporus]
MTSLGLMLSGVALAGQSPAQPQTGGGQQKPPPQAQQLDVEELNDNPAKYAGRTVSVAGEIKDKIDWRSFVLESGGIFDDEIVVLVPGDSQGLTPLRLSEDANVVVTGTVRSLPLVEVERQLGWDLDPELEVELEGTRDYLVADRIDYQRD